MRLQPGRDGRVRCSAWLGRVRVTLILLFLLRRAAGRRPEQQQAEHVPDDDRDDDREHFRPEPMDAELGSKHLGSDYGGGDQHPGSEAAPPVVRIQFYTVTFRKTCGRPNDRTQPRRADGVNRESGTESAIRRWLQ